MASESTPSINTATTKLSFGLVVSSSTSSDTTSRFDALADFLRKSETAKLDLTSHVAATYKDLATSIREGSSDIAWLPPVAFAWLAEAVTPIGSIVRAGATSYSAALVVRDDSSIRALADLKGVRAGWIDPWSAAGYVVPRIELARKKIDPAATFKTEAFLGNHRDALLALGRGDCDVVGTYARLPAVGQTEAAIVGAWSEIDDLHVRVLASFGAIPPDVIAVRRNLGPKEHQDVIRAFREAFADEKGRELIRGVFGGDELRDGTDPGHEVLRRSYETALANGLFD